MKVKEITGNNKLESNTTTRSNLTRGRRTFYGKITKKLLEQIHGIVIFFKLKTNIFYEIHKISLQASRKIKPPKQSNPNLHKSAPTTFKKRNPALEIKLKETSENDRDKFTRLVCEYL